MMRNKPMDHTNISHCMIYMAIVLMSVFCVISSHVIELKDVKTINPKSTTSMLRSGSTKGRTVDRFARHELCRHRNGQIHFYRILKSKLCDMDDMFVEMFVSELCNKKGKLLELWAGFLFDTDADGVVTDLERNFYSNKFA